MPDQQPTLYARLMDIQTDQPRRKLHAHFRDRAEKDADTVAGLLHTAYAEGVRDGFAQGIAAASTPENEEPAERGD
jgi:hypothetical protein